VREASRADTGKESNKIEDAEMGLRHRIEDVMAEYGKAHDPWTAWVVPVLNRMPLSLLEDETGLDRRTIQRNRNEHSRPQPQNAASHTRAAGGWARQCLVDWGLMPRNDVLAYRALVEVAS
jgi:hypothetical protein